MVDIIFAQPNEPIVAKPAIVHDNESFNIQWTAFNASGREVPAFVDRLVITSIPEGCPGSDDVEHDVVFDTDVDEDGLAAGAAGELVETEAGPFPAGAYRLTVTLADDLGTGKTTFLCIDIVKAA
jgi:hypothetical protein